MKLTDLTPRRRQIVELLAAGKTDKEIAVQLHISVLTVKQLIRLIAFQTGVRGRYCIVRCFYELRAID